jgi:hypothetical protein
MTQKQLPLSPYPASGPDQNPIPSRVFNGVPMGLPPANGDENPLNRRECFLPNRARKGAVPEFRS